MAPLAGHQAARINHELQASETLGNIHPQEMTRTGWCRPVRLLVMLPVITKYHFGPGTGQIPKNVPLLYYKSVLNCYSKDGPVPFCVLIQDKRMLCIS